MSETVRDYSSFHLFAVCFSLPNPVELLVQVIP